MILVAEGGFPKVVQMKANIPPFNPKLVTYVPSPANSPMMANTSPAEVKVRQTFREAVIVGLRSCRRSNMSRGLAVIAFESVGFSKGGKTVTQPPTGDDVATGL